MIVEDDPLDGSRALRKRKTSDDQDDATPAPSKRRKRQASRGASEISGTPCVAEAENDGDDEEVAVETTEAASSSTRKSRSSRPSRSRRLKSVHPTPVTITTNDHDSIIVGIRLNPQKLASVVTAPPKKKKRVRPSRARHAVLEREAERRELARPQPAVQSHYATPFYAFHEKENDDLKSKPYGGILSEADAETSKTLPLQADRVKFNEARQKAEEEWKSKTAAAEAELEHRGRSAPKVSGPPSKIKCVNIGGYEIETWYAAPYPEEYSRNRVLYICEFCLKYMNSDYVAWRHKLKCPAKHPPGDEIYRDGSISVFEVDGRKNPVYCQNLCLLAKLFLGSKTLYYDVEPFLFYVMTDYDELGCHFVGYFSKEKRPSSQNNVSCILTLPTHQRKGYGNLLISFSYLLTRVEGKTGSPEKPLSDMGLVSYRNYWRLILSYELIDQKSPLSIMDLSDRTGMTADDIVAALEGLRALVRDPITKSYALRLDYAYLKGCIDTWEAKGYVTLDPEALVWTPYIMGRSNLDHYDHAPALQTIAPREGEDEDPAVAPEEGVQQTLQAEAAAKVEAGGKEIPSKVNGDAVQLNEQLMPDTPGLLDPSIGPSTAVSPAFSGSQFASRVTDTPARTNGTPVPAPTPSIPATRYEVFPPIPGTVNRRRGGYRPGGGRKTGIGNNGSTTATPVRSNKNRGGKPPLGKGKGNPSPRLTGRLSRGSTVAPLCSERKTRSALREEGEDKGERERLAQFGWDGAGYEESGSEDADGEEEAVFDEALEDAIAGDEAAQQLVIGDENVSPMDDGHGKGYQNATEA